MNNRTYLVAAAAGIVVIAIVTTIFLWREPQVIVISSGPETQQAMLESLLAANAIEYRKNEDGQVTVASSELMPVRRLAAERGVIAAPRDGLESFKDDNYGATEFVQRVNYQRALQAEIERTVMKLDGVIDARVHMRQPKRTTFFRREQATRASILVKLEPWAELGSLAPSIAQIAAGAVDGLDAKDVNIVADNGDVTAGDGNVAGSVAAGSRQQETLERHYRDAIRTVLSPLYSNDRVGVTVTVELDRRKRTYRRDNVPIVTSRVTTRSEVGDSAEGVKKPGEVNEYSYGTESESVETPAGSIARIGIGVMIADYLSPAEVQNVEQLIASATGLSIARGDTIKVMSYTADSSAMSDAAVVSPALAVVTEGATAADEPNTVTYERKPLLGQISAIDRSEILPLSAVLLGGLLLIPLWFARRHYARRRLVRDVVQWIEEDGR